MKIIKLRALHLIRNKHVQILLAATASMVVLSFFRAYIAGSLMLDGHGLEGLSASILFAAFSISLGAYSYSFYKLWENNTLEFSQVRVLSYVLAILFSFMLPLLSNDIFSLLTYGDAANRGIEVYSGTQSLTASPFFRLMSDFYKGGPCVYGPVSLSCARLSSALSSGNIFIALAVYKVIALAFGAVFIESACRIRNLLKLSAKPFLFIALNPIFLLQGVAQLHCDAIAIAVAMAMVYFYLSQKWYVAFAFAALCMAVKISYVLMFPFLMAVLFIEKKSWKSFFTRLFAGALIYIITLSIVYAPYYSSTKTITGPFTAVFQQNPATSVAEILGDIIYFAQTLISTHADKATEGASQDIAWAIAKNISQLFSLLISALMFFRFVRSEMTVPKWLKVFSRLLLLFLLFYSHVFYAWYLMLFLPFMWYEDDRKFMQWVFVLTCFSNMHGIMSAINRSSPVYTAVIPLTFLTVSVFFWRFRNNFFRSV